MSEATVMVQRSRAGVTLFVSGELSARTANDFVQTATDMLDPENASVDVDLAGVTLIDSSGTGALARVLDRANEIGARMRILRPRRSTHRAIVASGVARVVEVGEPYEPR